MYLNSHNYIVREPSITFFKGKDKLYQEVIVRRRWSAKYFLLSAIIVIKENQIVG